MAKGKHATALFEVIHASKEHAGREKRARLLRTPKWWFKSRTGDSTGGPPGGDPTRAAAPITPLPEPAPGADPTARLSAAAAPEVARRTPAVDMLVDAARQQITFRVTYTSAFVTAFAIVVVVALAYLVGRQMSRGPAAAMAGPSTEQLRAGAARPDVLDVSAGAGGTSTQSIPAKQGSGTLSNPQPLNVPPPPTPTGMTAGGPVSAANGRRTAGLNYVIIQSYPDEASAKAAVDILRQHGVGATIEKGLRGLRSDWFTVVGTDGFSRVRAPEFEGYIKKIEAVSDKFTSRKSFKAFDPYGYKWDRP